MRLYWEAILSWMDLDEAGCAATNLLFCPVKDAPMGMYLSANFFGHIVEAPLMTTFSSLCLQVSALL